MRIERYTEVYLDDAMRLCRYICKDGAEGNMAVVMADPSEFPDPPKNMPFPERLYAVRVTREGQTIAECAYLKRREAGEAGKFRNRWLSSLKLGDEIRAARIRAGMTQEELAAKTGYRVHSIDAMERGRYVMDTTLLARLADALGCEIRLLQKTEIDD